MNILRYMPSHYVFRHALLLALALVCSVGTAFADIDTQLESRIKAAFLFKFTNYVDWPASAFDQRDASFVIGVMEDDEVANELSRLVKGRSVNNRPLLVRRLAAGDSITGSQVLFIGSSVGARLNRTLAAAKALPVLTVTDTDDGLSNGSVINFVVLDDQVRFDVSTFAAELGNLKVSSRLLTVARQVTTVAP